MKWLNYIVSVLICAIMPMVHAQSGFSNFTEVPAIYANDLCKFANLFRAAKFRPIQAVMFGDSQETCPEGLGDIYIPRFNYELASHYGSNSPTTPFVRLNNSTGTSPYCEWLTRAAKAGPGVDVTRLPVTSELPGFRGMKTSTTNGSNVNNNQSYGQLIALQPSASGVNPGAVIPSHKYFDDSAGVYIDVIGIGNQTSSGEIKMKMTNNLTPTPNYYSPIQLGTVTTSMGLEGITGFVTQRFGPITYDTSKFLQIELSGTDASKLTDVLSIQFSSVANPSGWTVTDIAEGGYYTGSIAANHPDSGPMLAALNPDVAFVTYGANDAYGYNYTPAQYKQGLLNIISFIKTNSGPNVLIILMADVYRGPSGGNPSTWMADYPGVCYEIAQADSSVMAINSRLLTEAAGWDQPHATTYLIDQVHYTSTGAITKARVEVDALWALFGCFADFDMDGTADFFDYDAYVIAFENGDICSDVTGDGAIDFFDYDAYVLMFEDGC